MKKLAPLLLLAVVCTIACAPKNFRIVTHSAVEACQVLDLSDVLAEARAVCLAAEELDALLARLFEAERHGMGVELVVANPDGSTETLQLAPAQVGKLAARVGALRR